RGLDVHVHDPGASRRVTSKRRPRLAGGVSMATVYFEDLVEGKEFVSDEVAIDKDEMLEYARKNDPWPFHVDEEAAKASPFGGLIASGGYAISLYSRARPLLFKR